MEQQENKTNSNEWIKKLEKELTELGVKKETSFTKVLPIYRYQKEKTK